MKQEGDLDQGDAFRLCCKLEDFSLADLTRLVQLRLAGSAARLLSTQLQDSHLMLPASLQTVEVSAAVHHLPALTGLMRWPDSLSVGIIPVLNVHGRDLSLYIDIKFAVRVRDPSTVVPPWSESYLPAGFTVLHLAVRCIDVVAMDADPILGEPNFYRLPGSDVPMVPDPVRELCRFWDLCPASYREMRLCTGTRAAGAADQSLTAFRHMRRLTSARDSHI